MTSAKIGVIEALDTSFLIFLFGSKVDNVGESFASGMPNERNYQREISTSYQKLYARHYARCMKDRPDQSAHPYARVVSRPNQNHMESKHHQTKVPTAQPIFLRCTKLKFIN